MSDSLRTGRIYVDSQLVADCRAAHSEDFEKPKRLVRAVIAALGDSRDHHLQNWTVSIRDTAILISLELCPMDAPMGPWIDPYAIVCDTGQVCPFNRDALGAEDDDGKPSRHLSLVKGGRLKRDEEDRKQWIDPGLIARWHEAREAHERAMAEWPFEKGEPPITGHALDRASDAILQAMGDATAYAVWHEVESDTLDIVDLCNGIQLAHITRDGRIHREERPL
jgi:hypothetical protein